MVYGVLNFVFAALLLWLSYYADRKIGSREYVSNPIIVMNSFLIVACVFMGLAVMLSLNSGSERFTTFLGKCMYLFMGLYSINFCAYCVFFPSFERSSLARFFIWAGYVFCAWLLFTKIYAVNITAFLGVRVDAKALFTGSLTNYFPYTWYDFYESFMTFFLPGLSAIIMLLRSENRDSRLDHQRTLLTALAMALAWVCVKLVAFASVRVALFSTIALSAFVFAQIVIVMAATTNFLYDFVSVSAAIGKGLAFYVLPAAFVGALFPLVWKLYGVSRGAFYVVFLIVIALASAASHQLRKVFKRLSGFHSNQYAAALEEDLARMDYSDDPSEIMGRMREIFTTNIGMDSFRVLIDMGNEELSSVYGSEGEKRLSFSARDRVFDYLLNMNAQVVLKSEVENGYRYVAVKRELLDFFRETGSAAIIILNEGRHIIGALLLGERSGGNIYSDYDLDTFRKLYSYFFVFGYYMKNIGNQEIVGTVNRELHMSEQIIDSIQGNMDPIRNRKYDVGHLMVHAHNIGGEFIDLIRLGEDRHMFVVGDISGKGISASMSMVIVKSIIRTYLAESADFKALVDKVNRFIRFNLPKGTFFEGVFALIDFRENTVYYINCGVPAMFLYTRSYNNVIEIQGPGHVLGFVKDITPYVKVSKIALKPGDILVTCTDGLIDAKSLRGEMFGKDRIQKVITENMALPAQMIAETTYESLVGFVGSELEDDVSIYVMKMGR